MLTILTDVFFAFLYTISKNVLIVLINVVIINEIKYQF